MKRNTKTTAKNTQAAAPKTAKKAAVKQSPVEKHIDAVAAVKAAKPAGDLKIHVNKTGRICFSAAWQAELAKATHIEFTIDNNVVLIKPVAAATEGASQIMNASRRAYISAGRTLKAAAIGFDGTQALDWTAAPAGKKGFTVSL